MDRTQSQETINALLEEKFNDIIERLERIEAQTMKTNGTVKDIQIWKAWATGVTIALWLVAVPLVIYVFNSEISHMKLEHQAIIETFV